MTKVALHLDVQMTGLRDQGFQILPLAGSTDIPDEPGVFMLLKSGNDGDAGSVVVIDYSTRSVAGLVALRVNEPEVAQHAPEWVAVKLLKSSRSAGGRVSTLHDQTYALRERLRPLVSR